MGTSKMIGVPMNKPSTSDKIVVGSSVAADISIDEDDNADSKGAVRLSKEEASDKDATGSMFCADDVIGTVLDICAAGANASLDDMNAMSIPIARIDVTKKFFFIDILVFIV
mmetsp:Transcript_21905/g.46212  ORF Transcript_21905/g.46212 Transcript_21905/m.46212 type:complete len:112 (+) Transcript_21905:450-785(+)